MLLINCLRQSAVLFQSPSLIPHPLILFLGSKFGPFWANFGSFFGHYAVALGDRESIGINLCPPKKLFTLLIFIDFE